MSDAWMVTYTRSEFDFKDPENSDINIVDIAHHLATKNRFNGACRHPYSVAQHSILVQAIVPYPCKRYALLHDAAEAYLPDMHPELKAMFPGYKPFENLIQAIIFEKFGIDPDEQAACKDIVKGYDLQMLATERKHFKLETPRPWKILKNIDPLDVQIYEERWEQTKATFLRIFEQLFPAVSGTRLYRAV